MRLRTCAGLVVGAALLAGCGVRLGGPSTIPFMSTALRLDGVSAADAAAQIQAAAADLVLIGADRDSAWFADVAGRTGLQLSGPGETGARALAFLTRADLEILGDTSLALEVPSGGRIHMHDALYRIDRQRLIDLMYVRYDEAADLRDATRTLLEYVATDVGANVVLLLAVEAATPAASDSVAVLLRALYPTAWDCTDAGRAGQAAPALGVRLFYGPRIRTSCRTARQLAGAGQPVIADLLVR